MPESSSFLHRWGFGPLFSYIAGILLPAVSASLRPELMSALGVPAYAVLFWTGPFVSAAAVVWSNWSTGWRIVWALLVPVFVLALIAAIFVLPS